MFYVKHFTHAHFVRGRTDRHIPWNGDELSSAGLAPARSGSPDAEASLGASLRELAAVVKLLQRTDSSEATVSATVN